MCVYVTEHVRLRASSGDEHPRDTVLGYIIEIHSKVTIGLCFRRRSILIRPETSSFSNVRRFISRLTPYRAGMTLDRGNVEHFVFQAMHSSRIQTIAPRVPVTSAASAAHCSGTLTKLCCFLVFRIFTPGVSSSSTRMGLARARERFSGEVQHGHPSPAVLCVATDGQINQGRRPPR